jgi:hypothetical protein
VYPLILRLFRLDRIFNMGKSLAVKTITQQQLYTMLFVGVVIDVGLLVAWHLGYDWHVDISYECKNDGDGFLWAFVALKALTLIGALVLCARTRNIPPAYNNSLTFAIIVICLMILGIGFILVRFASDDDIIMKYRCSTQIIAVCLFTGGVFLPKLVAYFCPTQDQLRRRKIKNLRSAGNKSFSRNSSMKRVDINDVDGLTKNDGQYLNKDNISKLLAITRELAAEKRAALFSKSRLLDSLTNKVMALDAQEFELQNEMDFLNATDKTQSGYEVTQLGNFILPPKAKSRLRSSMEEAAGSTDASDVKAPLVKKDDAVKNTVKTNDVAVTVNA